ncbi:hypothetical protein CR513_55127, partial [Mucuna pruriens]
MHCHINSPLMTKHIKRTYQVKDPPAPEVLPSGPDRTLEIRKVRVIDRLKILQVEAEDRGWMTPIWNYLHNGTSSKDKAMTAKVRWTTNRYIIEVDHLYKRGFPTHHLKCLTKAQADYILNEIYKGICEFHLMSKVGYYWLMMREDCRRRTPPSKWLGQSNQQVKISEPSLRRDSFNPSKKATSLRVDLDLLEKPKNKYAYDR